MTKISTKEYQKIYESLDTLSMNEKEKLFKKYQEGDTISMQILLESYYKDTIEYILKFAKKNNIQEIDDMIKYINSCLFKRMQICTSIFSYEKDSKRLIAREAARYMKRVKITNQKESFNFINLEIDERILKVLKDSLEPDVYYVFYQMVSGISIDEISNKLNIDLQEVKKRYVFALETLEIFLSNEEKRLKRRLYSIKEREGDKSSRIKITPYSVDSIIIYFYLKDTFTDKEQKLYYYQVFSNYQYYSNELCSSLNVDLTELESISVSLNEKIQSSSIDSSYLSYRDKMLNLYGPYLYNLVKSENYKKFDFSAIKEVVGLLSFEDIKKFLDEDCAYITANEKKLLYKYYYKGSHYSDEIEDVERDVNLNLFGYKITQDELKPQKYYETYLAHKDEFDECQCLFLECFYFKVRDKKDFIEKYPDSSLYYRYYMLTDRLEKLYYNVNNFLDNGFNKVKWLSIRDRYKERHTELRVRLLDLFYGVNCEPMTIKEIAKLYPDQTYIKVHDMVSDAREAAINMYTNKKHKIEITKEDYLPYLADKYEYTDETRKILTMFLKDNLTYEEISSQTGLNKTRISNIITDGIRKIDHYRLGILKTRDITEEIIGKIYQEYSDNFTDQEKEIYTLRYKYSNSNEAIAIILNIPRNDVNKAITHLNKLYDKFIIKNVSISESDVKKELRRHFTDTVLTEKEQQVLSLYYGIKSKYNVSGEKLEPTDIAPRLGITKNSYYHSLFSGIDKIKLRKIDAISPDLSVFERKELEEILKDRHLPISEKERYIINSLFALNNHKYKSIDELSKELGDLSGSIRRRYYRAMVNIKKYQNAEIEEQVDFETDLLPNLKYFSNSDRVFIYDYYKEHLSYEAMAKKNHLTMDMVLAIMNRIKVNVFELVNDRLNKKFDFDFYKKAIHNPDLPFYGDLDMAIQIFDLYFGMNEMRRLSIPEIKERLSISMMTSAINNAVYQLMISVCKLQEGIKKQKEFTHEDIVDYYNRHQHEMDSIHQVYYTRYFTRKNSVKELNGRKTKIPSMITYDILKEREPNLFRLSSASKEEIRAILENKSYVLESKTRHALNEKIHPYGELGGREINHIYRIINSLMERNLLFVDKGKTYRLKLEEQ